MWVGKVSRVYKDTLVSLMTKGFAGLKDNYTVVKSSALSGELIMYLEQCQHQNRQNLKKTYI